MLSPWTASSCSASSRQRVRKAVSLSRRSIEHDWKDTILGFTFSNVSAKNYRNRLICVEVIVCNISVVFFETQYTGVVHVSVNCCPSGFVQDVFRWSRCTNHGHFLAAGNPRCCRRSRNSVFAHHRRRSVHHVQTCSRPISRLLGDYVELCRDQLVGMVVRSAL